MVGCLCLWAPRGPSRLGPDCPAPPNGPPVLATGFVPSRLASFPVPRCPKESPGSRASDRQVPHLLGPLPPPSPRVPVRLQAGRPHLIDVAAVGAISLQAGGAGPAAVAGVLVHLHAVHAAEAGVGAAVRTLLVEAWGAGEVRATPRRPFRPRRGGGDRHCGAGGTGSPGARPAPHSPHT